MKRGGFGAADTGETETGRAMGSGLGAGEGAGVPAVVKFIGAEVFDLIGQPAKGKTCAGMKGLISEGSEAIEEDADEIFQDAAIIGAAQRVEHYEIAAYGTVRTLAELMGENEHVTLLEQTLEEEKQTDQKLTELAEDVNSEAMETEEEAEGEESESTSGNRSRSGKSSSRRAA